MSRKSIDRIHQKLQKPSCSPGNQGLEINTTPIINSGYSFLLNGIRIHCIPFKSFFKFFTLLLVHKLSGQNKRFWLRRVEKTSHGFLISIRSLVYGTGHYLGKKSSFHIFWTFSGGRDEFFQKTRNS